MNRLTRIPLQGWIMISGLLALVYIVWWSLHDPGASMGDVRGRWCVDREATRPLLADAGGTGTPATAKTASADTALQAWDDVVITIGSREVRFDGKDGESTTLPVTVTLARRDFIALQLGEERKVGIFIDGNRLTWRESGLALVLVPKR